MARTKIENLPKNMTIGKEEMKKVLGGNGDLVQYPPQKLGPYPYDWEEDRRERREITTTDPRTGQSVVVYEI